MFQMKARPQTRTAKRFGLAALLLLVLVLCLVGGKTAQAGNEQVYVVGPSLQKRARPGMACWRKAGSLSSPIARPWTRYFSS